ncbi:hypothetical protein FRB99_000470 [Tulasnella sp. 403]|nr:hypothetical protein FRB99_000470 [Tulasnella sp. 403]
MSFASLRIPSSSAEADLPLLSRLAVNVLAQRPPLTRWSPFWHLLMAFLAYAVIMSYHTRRAIWSYRGGASRSRLILAAHVLAGVYEISHWYIGSLSAPPKPTASDLFACLVHSATNLMLTKSLRRGQPKFTRPSYQAGAILRIAPALLAWKNQDPLLHETAVKLLHAFAFTRVLIYVAGIIGLFKSYAEVYSFGVFVGAVLAFLNCPQPQFANVYIVTVFLVVLVNQWTTDVTEGKLAQSPTSRMIAKFLLSLGFANLETVQMARHSTEELLQEKQDDYVS